MSKLYGAIAFLLVLGALFGAHLYDKQRAVSLAVENVELQYEAKLREAEALSAKVETQLLVEHFNLRDEKENEILSITAKHDATVAGLRTRTSRAESASAACIRGPITGAQLPREDGEFLAGEASRAERVLKERDYYYKEYESARKKLEEHANRQK